MSGRVEKPKVVSVGAFTIPHQELYDEMISDMLFESNDITKIKLNDAYECINAHMEGKDISRHHVSIYYYKVYWMLAEFEVY